MPTSVYVDQVSPERDVSKLSRALSKLALRADERQSPVTTLDPGRFQPDSRNTICDARTPQGPNKYRFRDHIHGTPVSPSRKAFRPRYSEIIPDRLFISDRSTGTDARVLLRLRITHVVCIVNSWDQFCPSLPALRYHAFVVPRDVHQVTGLVAYIDDSVDFMDGALRRNDTRVLVHCPTGTQWSQSMVIAWFMRNANCTYEQALETLRRKQGVVDPWVNLEKGVKEWWALELARPSFPLGRGGREPTNPVALAQEEVMEITYEEEGEVIDIRRYP